jgi:O-antigen ligase
MSQTIEAAGGSPLASRETASVWSAAGKRPIAIEGAWTTLLSCLIGGGIAMTGFPPLNNVSAVLHMQALPLLVVLSPTCLLALLAVWTVWRSQPDLRWLTRVPPTATLCFVLVSLGGAMSLLQSTQPGYSAALLTAGILAPALIFLSVRSGALRPSYMAGAFIAVLVVLLGRADLVFLSQHGLPTAQTLYNAKFSSRPYDFHYYTLGNPDETAAFLIIPLTLCLFWAMGRSTRRSTRLWLLLASGMILVSFFLLYIRLADLFAVAVLIAAVLCSPWPTRIRWGIVGIVVAVFVAFSAASPGHYLLHIFQTSNGASGAVRIGSVEAGWNALLHHPLTGVGLGMFGSRAAAPAHSSILQAGAEMGALGLLGLAAMTVSLVWVAVRSVRIGEWIGFRGAASLAAATYVIYAALSGGAYEGLMVGFTSIYGLTLAMAAGIGVSASSDAEDGHVPLADALRAVSAAAGRGVRRRWLALRPLLPWIAYGAAWAAMTAWLIARGLPSQLGLSGSRAENLVQLLAAHRQGFGPMVQMVGPGVFVPAGVADDPGSYLYVPWLSSILHTQSLDTLVRAPYVLCMAILAGIYPYLMWRLTRSRLAGLAAPLIVILSFRVLDGQGFFWVPAWAIALSLPWLWLLARRRSAPLGALIAIGAVAGVTSTFRSHTGLGILVAAAVVSIAATASWRARAARLILVAAAYLFMSTGVLDLAYQARAARMGSHAIADYGEAGITKWSDPTGHPLWHDVYIGLGVIPNRYGISYRDSVAFAYVHKIDPTAKYYSPRYEAIVRKRVIHIAETDPGFVARAETHKAEVELGDGLTRFAALILLLPAALLTRAGRRRRLVYAGILAPIALDAFAPAVVAIPYTEYELPWFGVLGCLTVVTACWLLARAGRALAIVAASPAASPAVTPLAQCATDLRVHMHSTWERVKMRAARFTTYAFRPLRRLAVAIAHPIRRMIAAGIESGRAGARVMHAVDSERVSKAARRAGGAALRSRYSYIALALVVLGLVGRNYLGGLPATTLGGLPATTGPVPGDSVEPLGVQLKPPLRSWTSTGMLSSWVPGVPRVKATTANGTLDVLTSPQSQAYQLISPNTTLPTGRYVAVVRGQVQDGGLTLGVLEVKSQRWVKTAVFGSSEEPYAVTMPVLFSLSKRTAIEIILANNTRSNHVSHWRVRAVSINPYGLPASQRSPAPRHPHP